MGSGEAGGDDGLHLLAGAVFLAIGEEAEVTGDVGGGRNDICFAECDASGVLRVDLDIGAADDQAGVEGQVLFVAQLFAESVEDAGCFIDGAVARGVGEDTGGMAGLCGDVHGPAAGAAAGGRHGIEAFGSLEGERNIATSSTVDKILPGCGVGRTGAFLIAGEIGDDIHVFQLAGGRRVVKLRIWAGGHIGFKDGIEVAGAVERVRFVDPFDGKAELLQFVGVEGAYLLHAFDIEGAAIDVDGVDEKADRGVDVGVDVVCELSFGGGKLGVG
jgi:hypothetical protein